MKLNLGSWENPMDGYVNIDILPLDGVDKVCDLNKLPWPFPDESVDYVRAVFIVEHLDKLSKREIVGEIARVMKPGAEAEVVVPCAGQPLALQSLQHAHSFYLDSFEPSYAQPYFDVIERRIGMFASQKRFGGIVRLPFVRPLRLLIRVLARLGAVTTLRFYLRRR